MTSAAKHAGRFERILDAFASRFGVVAVFGFLFLVCLGAGVYVQSVVTHLERNHTTFKDSDARNGYVAMSDIQRLLLVAQRAEVMGGMNSALEKEFRDATDVLYVRTDSFRKKMAQQSNLASGGVAIAAMERIVKIADRAIEEGFPDDAHLVAALLMASADARSKLVLFLDDMRRKADRILETQSRAVRKQQFVVLGSIASLTLVGCVALLLLRLEVLGRHAREVAEKRVAYLAFYDPLTNLPNRTQFQDRLQGMLDNKDVLALLYVDLDDFKMINDTYGHAAGDAVLCHTAKILDKVSGGFGGFAARLGGDEFALVIPGDGSERLTQLCQSILNDACQTFSHDGETFEIGLSVGLATTTQVGMQMTVTLDMLSRVTDFALYASKSAGRRCYTFYDQDLEVRFQERRAMLEELPHAIENDDLEVHLQPKVTLSDRAVYGFEALVRWRRGADLIPPDEFILIAEESGLVVDVDHYVLRQATQIIAEWNKDHGSEFSVSINLSALHFSSLRIVEWVQDALWSSGLEPALLTLEITETMEMRDWTQASRVISRLRNLGAKISIDDFGTGFSSLAYLRATNADELKIDRSLVFQLETSEKARLLLGPVLEIARNLEFEVIVEGIETEAQAEIVQNMGAHFGQGFLYGRPSEPHQALTDATFASGTDIKSIAS